MVAVRPESSSKQYPMPFTRIEIAVMSLVDGELHVLLARRAESPHAGKWSLPGGVLRIDLDRSLEMGARRVMNERLQELGEAGSPKPFCQGPELQVHLGRHVVR